MVLGQEGGGRRHWGENPQAKQALTADNTVEALAAHTQAKAAGGKASGSWGRQESPLPRTSAALPPDPCTTLCLSTLWVPEGQRLSS